MSETTFEPRKFHNRCHLVPSSQLDDTVEAYQFTAIASVLAVEQTLERQLAGALSPALAFGKDFVLAIDGTRRIDSLDVGDWQSLVN